jgi:hypothetical protein
MTYNGQDLIPSLAFEKEIIEAVDRYVRLLTELQVNLPIFVLLTLLDVKGLYLGVDRNRFWMSEQLGIDRPDIVIPAVTVESVPCDSGMILRPVFDRLWQAAGWNECKDYDQDGHWAPSG